MAEKQFEIKIGVNSSGVVTGINGAIRQIKRLTDFAKGIAAGLGVIGVGSLIKSTVEDIIKWGAEIQKTARANGMAVDEFQELSAASKELSIDVNDSVTAFKKLQLAQVEALKGNAELQRAFLRRGINMNTLRGMTPKQLFDATGESFSKSAPSAQVTADAIALMGKNATAMLGAFRGGFMDAMRDAKNLGEVLEQDVVNSLVRADDAMTRFGLQTKVAIAGMIPPLIDLTEQILTATKATWIWFKTWHKEGNFWGGNATAADKAVKEFFDLQDKAAADKAKYQKSGKPATDAAGVLSNTNATNAKPVTDKLLSIGIQRGGGNIATIPTQQLQELRKANAQLARIAKSAETQGYTPQVNEVISGLRDMVGVLTPLFRFE